MIILLSEEWEPYVTRIPFLDSYTLFNGTIFADLLTGTSGNDLIAGGGNDTILGNAGDDAILHLHPRDHKSY